MPDKTVTQWQPAAFHLNDLVNAPAWRIHLEPQFAVCWAGIQAEATVDALGKVLPLGRLTRPVTTSAGSRLVLNLYHFV